MAMSLSKSISACLIYLLVLPSHCLHQINAQGVCKAKDFLIAYREYLHFSHGSLDRNLLYSSERIWNRNETGSVLVFPEENLDQWVATSGVGPRSSHGLVSDRERNRSDWGMQKFAYDVLISDTIGPNRSVPDTRHQLCENIEYDGRRLPSASIVICYHNEALSVLIRMINAILERTPLDLIHEILLVDDWSDEDMIIQHYLIKYGNSRWPTDKVKFSKTEERLGLIRCRVHGAYKATGEALIFLDSHCEVNRVWLEPLLDRLVVDPKIIAEPIIDLIDPIDFSYQGALVSRGAFDWDLNFHWLYFNPNYFEEPENNTRPIETPAICGGLFAIRKDYFHYLGDYDTKMNIWGAENVEISVRTWTCGGRIERVPCSRIGHVFRRYRPYSNPKGGGTTVHINALRTVLVWFDEYQKNFFAIHPHLENYKEYDYGNVSDRVELRRTLQCKPFRWFLDNVYPEWTAMDNGTK